jgi:hypothetical protein
VRHCDALGSYSGFESGDGGPPSGGPGGNSGPATDTTYLGDNIFDKRLLTSTKKDGSGYLTVMTFDVETA